MLYISIDRENKVAQFYGPGTFSAKDLIKELGKARWLGDKKVWEVRDFSLSLDELRLLFPEVEIKEITGGELIKPKEVESAGREVPAGISVSGFYKKVKSVLRGTFSESVFIFGVISQIKASKKGQYFIDLVDAEKPDECVSCVIWSNFEQITTNLKQLGFELEPQLQVMFQVEVSFNARDGRVSLTVQRIVHEYTLAKLALQREVTNNRLKAEGVFDANKRLELSYLPKRLGILTSAGGTVINDFLAALEEGKFGFELFWFPVVVQGAEAKSSLLAGIEYFSVRKDLDALLIFRGGGSQADLAVFNDYDVAKAVCAFPYPIISAIGHQEDQSSVQDVSFKGLGVPKDIGTFFANIVLNFRERLSRNISIVKTTFAVKFEQLNDSLTRLTQVILNTSRLLNDRFEDDCRRFIRELPVAFSIIEKNERLRLSEFTRSYGILAGSFVRTKIFQLQTAVGLAVSRLSNLNERLDFRLLQFSKDMRANQSIFERSQSELESIAKLIESCSIDSQLKRGFALVRDVTRDRIITRSTEIGASKSLEIQFFDGRVKTMIHEV